MRLTDEQVERFRQEGYLVVPGVIPREKCNELKPRLLEDVAEGIEQLDSHVAAGTLPEMNREQIADVPRAIRKGMLQDLAHRDPVFMELARSEELVSCVAPILGDELALYRSLSVFKSKEAARPVGWHQDMSYWRGDAKKVSLWLALDDVTADNGAMRFIPGSQEIEVPQEELEEQDEVFSLTIPDHYIDADRAQLAEVDAGGAVLFDARVFHGSGPNVAGRDRYAVVFTYQPAHDSSHHRGGAPVIVSG
jgi:phytanoyl-CoA hydroxylase